MSESEQTEFANDVLTYVTDEIVNEHTSIDHGDPACFTEGHRIYLGGLSDYIAGLGRTYSPDGSLPVWDPSTPIPTALQQVDAEDDGTPRDPIVNGDPGLATPPDLSSDSICQYATIDELYDATNRWHARVHTSIGGAMSVIATASAAAVFWPWHNYIDQIYELWQSCAPYPEGSADDSLDGWQWNHSTARGVSVYTDTSAHALQDYIAISDTGSSPTTVFRDISLSSYASMIDARQLEGTLSARRRVTDTSCSTGKPILKLEYRTADGRSLGSTRKAYSDGSTDWVPGKASLEIPPGTRKVRISLISSANSRYLACATQEAHFEYVRFSLSLIGSPTATSTIDGATTVTDATVSP